VFQRRLDEASEHTRFDTSAVTARLKSQFTDKHKLFIVTYSLPVVLRKDPVTGSWSATWIEDDFLARTPHSICDDVKTIWVGAVTRECIDLSTAVEAKRPTRSHSMCGDEDAAMASLRTDMQRVMAQVSGAGCAAGDRG